MSAPVHRSPPDTLPLYLRVAEIIKSMIETRQLGHGDKVPSLRNISRQAKVSLTTAIQAYAHLEDLGILESRPQSGYYVTATARLNVEPPDRVSTQHQPREAKGFNVWGSIYESATQPGVIPLGLAMTAPDILPVNGLNRSVRKVLSQQAMHTLKYSFPPGELVLRQQIANSYYRINQQVHADDLIITNGATEALMISLKAVAKAGDVIAVESPVYFVVLRIVRSLGMTVLEIESDPKTGMSVESLKKALGAIDVKAVICVPNFSNPTGALMPDEMKRKLVALLGERQIPLIEDDIYGELYAGRHRPSNCREFIQSPTMDSRDGLVITCSSFSKTLAPGYRVGWVLPGKFGDRVIRQKRLASAATGTLSQLAIADFMQSGSYERHLRQLRINCQQQVTQMRAAIAGAFPTGTRISDPKGSFVLWVQLPGNLDTLALAERCMQENISIAPGEMFSVTDKYRGFLRFCAGAPWSQTLETAIKRVGELIAETAGSP